MLGNLFLREPGAIFLVSEIACSGLVMRVSGAWHRSCNPADPLRVVIGSRTLSLPQLAEPKLQISFCKTLIIK